MRDQRPHLVEIRAEQVGLHGAAARVHPVDVAAHRVDFAIVGHKAERMRQLPAGEGVGRKPLVHEAQRRDAQRVAQIIVKTADLRCQQQPLIDNRAARKAGQVKLGQPGQAVLFSQRGQRVLHLLANGQKLAFKRVLVGAAGAATNDALADNRHRFDHRLAKPIHGNRHIAPADQDLAFLFQEFFQRFDDEIAAVLVLRQEAHGHGIIALGRQGDIGLGRPVAKQRVGQLDEDAGTIAQQRVGANRAAMIQVFEDFQRLGNNPMTFSALDMGNKAHPARVMFVPRIV